MFKAIKSFGLGTRIISLSLIIMISVVAVNCVIFVAKYRDSAVKAMVKRAAEFTAVAGETKKHVASQNKLEVFDTPALLEDLKRTRESGKSYTDAKIFGTLPIVAGWTAAQEAAKKENIDFKVTSFDTRNKKYEPASGSFEEKLLRDLTTRVNAGGEGFIHKTNTETNSLHYTRAIRLTDDCMSCHGDPADSLTGDGKDPVGFTMKNGKPGFMHGTYHVVMPMDPVDTQVAGFITNSLGLITGAEDELAVRTQLQLLF